MREWLRANIWNILIIAAVAAMAIFAVVYMIRRRRKGKSVLGCGGSCSACPYGSMGCGGGKTPGRDEEPSRK